MNDNEIKDIPYIVFESSLAREERHNKRLVAIIIVILFLWLITILIGVWYMTLPVESYSEITQETEDAEGDVVQHIGGSYGEGETD